MSLLLWMLLASLSLTTSQPAVTEFVFAAIRLDESVWVDGETLPAPDVMYRDMAWSEDGRYLAYHIHCDNIVCVMQFDTETGEITQLTDGVAVWFHPLLDDGSLLSVKPNFDVSLPFGEYYEGDEFWTPVQHDVYRDDEVIGSFVYQAECQGGPPDWAFANRSGETGRNGNAQQFAITPYGILHSISCSGIGTALLDLETNESTLLGTRLARTVVSQDGRYVIGVDENVLTRIDLETGELQAFETEAEPDQVVWGHKNTIYYSTREATDEIRVTATEEETLREYWFYTGSTVDTYTVTIRRYDLVTGEETLIYTSDAYAVARMQSTERGLIFSQIPNLNEWIEIGLQAEVDETLLDEAIAPRIYVLDVDIGEALDIATGLFRFAIKPE